MGIVPARFPTPGPAHGGRLGRAKAEMRRSIQSLLHDSPGSLAVGVVLEQLRFRGEHEGPKSGRCHSCGVEAESFGLDWRHSLYWECWPCIDSRREETKGA